MPLTVIWNAGLLDLSVQAFGRLKERKNLNQMRELILCWHPNITCALVEQVVVERQEPLGKGRYLFLTTSFFRSRLLLTGHCTSHFGQRNLSVETFMNAWPPR